MHSSTSPPQMPACTRTPHSLHHPHKLHVEHRNCNPGVVHMLLLSQVLTIRTPPPRKYHVEIGCLLWVRYMVGGLLCTPSPKFPLLKSERLKKAEANLSILPRPIGGDGQEGLTLQTLRHASTKAQNSAQLQICAASNLPSSKNNKQQ